MPKNFLGFPSCKSDFEEIYWFNMANIIRRKNQCKMGLPKMGKMGVPYSQAEQLDRLEMKVENVVTQG